MTVLLVVIVSAMLFVIPTWIEVALAETGGGVYLYGGAQFITVTGQMEEGRFIGPFYHDFTRITWVTAPSVPGGAEKGFVRAQINILGTALFSFDKPISGEPTCSVRLASSQLEGTCTIDGDPDRPVFIYEVKFKKHPNTNKYCDILTNLDRLSQLKIISEKLHC